MITTTNLLILLSVWFFTENDYIQGILDLLRDGVNLEHKLGKLLHIIFDILTCFKCLTFWSFLFITLNPLLALTASFTASIYQKINNKLK